MNIASRLESYDKELGKDNPWRILIGETTLSYLDGHYDIQVIGEADLKGKTNHDFLSKEIADMYRNSDLEALKAGKEIQIEEIIEHSDGPHAYLSVKFPL